VCDHTDCTRIPTKPVPGGDILKACSFYTREFSAPGRIRTDNRLIRRSELSPIIVAGMLGHSLAILMTTYAHLARFARYAPYGRNIPGTQESRSASPPLLQQLT
jgi:hypothetical protein